MFDREARIEELRKLELFCYRYAFHLTGENDLSAKLAQDVLVYLYTSDSFFVMLDTEKIQFIKEVSDKLSKTL